MTHYKSNPFVTACARGDLGEVRRRLDAKEDINQLNVQPKDDTRAPDFNDPAVAEEICKVIEDHLPEINAFAHTQALSAIPSTEAMSGLGAAMAAHQMAVVEELVKRGANPAIGRQHEYQGYDMESAVEIGVQFGFHAGVAYLTEHCNIPLWTRTDRPATDLLFDALPRITHIHSFTEEFPADEIARAHMLDDAKIRNGLAMFDNLVDRHHLSVDTRNHRGETLVMVASQRSGEGFYGDAGRVLRHVLARGGDPNVECAIDRSKDWKVQYTPGFLKEVTGEDNEACSSESLRDLFGLINKGRRDQGQLFETTPLIYACYKLNHYVARILLEDPRTDPMRIDANGNNAFFALEEGRLDSIIGSFTKEECRELQNMLAARVQARRDINHMPPSLKPN